MENIDYDVLYKALNLFRHQAKFFLAVTLFECSRAAQYMNSAQSFLKSWFSSPLMLPTFRRNTKRLVSPTLAQSALQNTAPVWTQCFFHLSNYLFLISMQVFMLCTNSIMCLRSRVDLPSPPKHTALRKGSSDAASSISANEAVFTSNKRSKNKWITNYKMLLLKQKQEVGEVLPKH